MANILLHLPEDNVKGLLLDCCGVVRGYNLSEMKEKIFSIEQLVAASEVIKKLSAKQLAEIADDMPWLQDCDETVTITGNKGLRNRITDVNYRLLNTILVAPGVIFSFKFVVGLGDEWNLSQDHHGITLLSSDLLVDELINRYVTIYNGAFRLNVRLKHASGLCCSKSWRIVSL